MKLAWFSTDETFGRGLGLRYSNPNRARSLMQPECEYSKPNSEAMQDLISTVERQKRPSSHAHNSSVLNNHQVFDYIDKRRKFVVSKMQGLVLLVQKPCNFET